MPTEPAARVKHEEGCCGRAAMFMSRWVTFGVVVIGLALTSYSAFLLVESHSISVVSGTILAFGLIDVLVGLVVACWGINSRCCLDMWVWGFGLVTVAQTIVAILFFVPGTRKSIVDAIPDAETKKLMEENATPVGIGLLVAMGVQSASIAFSYCRKVQLENRVDDPELQPRADPASAHLLDSTSGSGAGRPDRDDAARRYREKRSGMYEKYGIKR